MIVAAVAVVIVIVVIATLLAGATSRLAFCPRRESVVEFRDGRCAYREGACANAPAGCERECVMLSDLAARAS